MTFAEAIALKNKFGSAYFIPSTQKVGQVLIVPETQEFFSEYMDEFHFLPKIDESSKRFAKDDKYMVMVIQTDGLNSYSGKRLSDQDLQTDQSDHT